MVFAIRLTLLLALCVFASLVFEWRHIWPVNQDRALLLRLVFYGLLLTSLVVAHVRQYHTWGWFILFLAFAVTSLVSRAEIDLRFLLMAGFCVAAFAGLTLWRSPLPQ